MAGGGGRRLAVRRAKAFLISLLGEFAEISSSKQVNLEAKVRQSSSAGRGLVEEAASLNATYIVVGGGSRSTSPRLSFAISKYCLEHAPEGCMVIAIGTRGLAQLDSYADISVYEGLRRHLSPLHRFTRSRKKRGGSFDKMTASPSEGKTSPSTVLDGPEDDGADGGAAEDCSTPCGDGAGRSGHLWRRSSSVIKRLLPFLRSAAAAAGLQRGGGWSPNGEQAKTCWRFFSYQEISRATNNFYPGNMVGRGGYAEVYRGDLDDGREIAVKRLAKGVVTDVQKEREFLAELGVLSHVCHPNTACLVGYCLDNGLHLVFDFCPNASLASVLHGRKSGGVLEWPARLKIAAGVARGLHYLHRCCRRRIIHRDIKASNILLGEDLEPRISDFGLARWLPRQWNHLSIIPVEGTFGYLAPECFVDGIVDEKTDVFAFGILLLEIITGRRPVDDSKQSLLLWARPRVKAGNVAGLADPALEGRYDTEQMEKLVLTASYCIRQSSASRPPMAEVLQLLTEGHNSGVAESWRMSEIGSDAADETSDYCSALF